MLFALKKLNVIDHDELTKLDRSWKKYRKASNLDAYGKPSCSYSGAQKPASL
jgi:hypothetical protein